MNVSHPIEPVTPEEFERMDKDERLTYELIDGVVLASPRPSIAHQSISGNLFAELRHILRGKGCRPFIEIDLVLNDNYFVPDVLVDCSDLSKEQQCQQPPLIVIEVVSPSSTSRDHIIKRSQYEQLGIQEYWIVSPEEKCITVFAFTTNEQQMYCAGQVKSIVMPDIAIDLESIFDLSY